MAARTSPTFRKRRLGRRLRELRERAGLTLDQAAPRLYKTRSSLHRIEVGETRADVHLIKSMMDLYDVRDDELIDLSLDASRDGWWRQYGLDNMGYVPVETEACRVLEFSLVNIPGLLQTEAYYRAGLATASRHRTAEQLDNQVTVRRIRQLRLTDDEHPLELAAVVDEAALHRIVGGPEVMLAQLTRLLEASDLDRVALQVLPFSAGRHHMDGAFTLLEFPEPDDPDLLYLAHVAGALHLEKDADVRKARLAHERLSAQALSPEQSAELIGRVAHDVYPSP